MPAAILTFRCDYPARGEADFNAWYDREHMPERMALPGFRHAARYVAVGGKPKYLTVYEVAGPATLKSKAYLARLDDPTPWTQKIMRRVRNASRTVYRRTGDAGRGCGAAAATLEYALPDARTAARIERRMAALARAPGIARVQLWRSDPGLSDLDTAESRLRGDAGTPERWCLFVEASAAAALQAALSRHADTAALRRAGATGVRRRRYRLMLTMARGS